MPLVDTIETFQMTNVGDHIDGTDVYQSNRNLLDNWYFVGGGSQLGGETFPINQRGQTSYTGQLAIDRWHADDTVTLYSDYLNTGNGTIYQVCDNGKITPLLGKAVTASMMLADGTIVSDTQVFPDDTNNRWVIFGSTGMASFLAGATSQIIRLPGSNNIKAAKLELGTVSTLANDVAPDFGEELRKCQRFFCSSFPLTTAPEAGNSAEWYASMGTARNNGCYSVWFPVEMYSVPTVLKLGMAYVFAALPDGTENATYDTSIAPSNITTKGFRANNSFYNGFATFGFSWYASCEI